MNLGYGTLSIMIPGWYPDPYGNGTLRWWDGATWTGFTAPYPGGAIGLPPRDAAADLAGERAAGRRAAIALPVGAVLVIAWMLYIAVVFGHDVHTLIRQFQDNLDAGGDRPITFNFGFGFGPGQSSGLNLDLLWLPSVAVEILTMIWLYRAASVARRAGLPAARAPYWAWLGFLVPVVNLWFPYLVARDTTPHGDPARGAAGRWWAWSLAQNFVLWPVAVVSISSTRAAAIVAVVAAVVPIMAAHEGRALIAAVTESHTRLLAR